MKIDMGDRAGKGQLRKAGQRSIQMRRKGKLFFLELFPFDVASPPTWMHCWLKRALLK